MDHREIGKQKLLFKMCTVILIKMLACFVKNKEYTIIVNKRGIIKTNARKLMLNVVPCCTMISTISESSMYAIQTIVAQRI